MRTPGARARQGRHHRAAPADLQSAFGRRYGARFVGLQGLLNFKGRSGPDLADLQSEFGDGYGARVVGLQGRPDLQTYSEFHGWVLCRRQQPGQPHRMR